MDAQLVWAWTVGIGTGILLASSGIGFLIFTIRAYHEVHIVRGE